MLAQFGRAAEFYRAAGDLRGEASAHAKLGAFYESMASAFENAMLADSAAAHFYRAAELLAGYGDRHGELLILDALERLERHHFFAPDTALSLARRALRLERERGAGEVQVARRTARLADLHLAYGDPDSAVALYRGAIAAFRPSETPSFLLEGLGDVFAALGQSDSALAAYEGANAAAEGVASNIEQLFLGRKLWAAYFSRGDYRRVITAYEEAFRATLEATSECTDCTGFLDLELLELAASAYDRLGKPDSAAMVTAERFARRRLLLVSEQDAAALVDEIRASLGELIALHEATGSASGTEDRDALFEIGRRYAEFEHAPLAIRYLRAALDASDAGRGVGPDVEILQMLATAYEDTWQFDSAQASRQAAIDRLRRVGQPVSPSLLRALVLAQIPTFSEPHLPENVEDLRRTLEAALRSAEGAPENAALADSIRLDLLRLEYAQARADASADPSHAIEALARAVRVADQLGVAEWTPQIPLESVSFVEFADSGAVLLSEDTLPSQPTSVDAEPVRSVRLRLAALLSAADSAALQGIFEEILRRVTEQNVALLMGGLDEASARAAIRNLLAASDAIGPLFGPVFLASVGSVHAWLGQADSALYYARAAVARIRENPGNPLEGIALLGLASVYFSLEQPDSALTALERAQAETPMGYVPLIDALLFQISTGVFLEFGLPERALAHARRSLPTRLDGDQLFRSDASGGLVTLAEAYLHLERPNLALTILRTASRSNDLATVEGGEEPLILSGLARAHAMLGRHDSATSYFRRSLAAAERAPSFVVRRGVLWPLLGLAQLQLASGQVDSAIAYGERAVVAAEQMRDPLQRARALLTLALAHQRVATGPALSRSVAYHDSAFQLLARVRTRVGSDENRLGFAAQFSEQVASWALTWLARGSDPDVGERRAALAALAVTENGRAQALLDLVGSRAATSPRASPAGSPAPIGGDDLPSVADSLVISAVPAGGAMLAYLVTSDTLVVWLIRDGGEIQVARTAVADSTLAVLGGRLRVALDPVGPAVDSGRGIASLERRSQDHAMLEAPSPDAAARAAQALSDLLLPPQIRPLIPEQGELLIIPHGVVGIIPFAMLPTDEHGSTLGERHALRYAPSIRMASLVSEYPVGASGISGTSEALVVGDPLMPSAQVDFEWVRLEQLSQAALEADSIAVWFGSAELTSGQATETAVRSRMPEARLIHLATHGYAYSADRLADRSFVALGPDEQNDGLLTVGEILSDPELSLRADLVVLSACQTGLGVLREAEGSLGLQRAFLARGARTVLVSLWDVDDLATAVLMRSFYSYWLAGHSKAEALRRAQNDVRSVEGLDHPRFWAAFQVVGAN